MPELHPMTSLALYAAVCGLVIVECGLSVGFLLPGDSMPAMAR
jgi:hypothetical protein